MEVPELLPHLYLVDVLGPDQFRFRLIGEQVILLCGRNATGAMIDENWFGEDASSLIAMYRHVVATRRPILNWGRLLWTEQSWRQFTNLILPLAQDGCSVDTLLGIMDAPASHAENDFGVDRLARIGWTSFDPDAEPPLALIDRKVPRAPQDRPRPSLAVAS